jgi:hypothetical protein
LFIWKKVDVKKEGGGGNFLKKNKNKGSNIGSCPQVPVQLSHKISENNLIDQ